VFAVFQNVSDNVFQEIFRQVNVIFQIIESHFWLYHPELGEMSGCIGVLGTESRPESINPSQSHGCSFCFQLPGNGKICFFTEKIFGIIHLSVFVSRNLVQIKGGNAKHFASTFCICSGDNRRIDIEKMIFMEKLMNSKTHCTSHPKNGTEKIGTEPKMCLFAKHF